MRPARSINLSLVKTRPPMKSRTYASLEFKAEDRQTSPLCSKFSSSSSLSAPVRSGRCVAAALASCGKPRSETASDGAEEGAPATTARGYRSSFLDGAPPIVANLGESLVIVKADTVARWHRDRFRRYSAKISRRRRPGRPRVDAEVRHLIRTMSQDGWGAPRIHAELTKLGFTVSEVTVSRYLPRRPAEPDEVNARTNE